VCGVCARRRITMTMMIIIIIIIIMLSSVAVAVVIFLTFLFEIKIIASIYDFIRKIHSRSSFISPVYQLPLHSECLLPPRFSRNTNIIIFPFRIFFNYCDPLNLFYAVNKPYYVQQSTMSICIRRAG